MDWLSQNWIWVLFFIAFIGMHLFGHGGHGGGGGHGGHGGGCGGRDEQEPAGGEKPERPQGHHH